MTSPAAVVVLHNSQKPLACQLTSTLTTWLRKQGVVVLSPRQVSKATLVVSLGGDGTLLASAACAAPQGVPVLGVNVGRLGFLAATPHRQLLRMMDQALAGRLPVSERMMLAVEFLGKGKKSFALPRLALNDCVVRGGDTARVVPLTASVNGQYLTTYVGDGVILSTPTGSTAYSMAAQGPIVSPELNLLLLTPICAHSLTQRPVILPPEAVVEIHLATNTSRVLVSLDGQHTQPLSQHDGVRVSRSPHRLKLMGLSTESFFPLLREKLGWGDR